MTVNSRNHRCRSPSPQDDLGPFEFRRLWAFFSDAQVRPGRRFFLRLSSAWERANMSPQYNRIMSIAYNHHPLHDTVIARRAQERLHGSAFAELRGLTCDVHEGMLTLRGHLPNFYTKQVALSLVAEIEGVEEITDRVEVA